MLYRDVWDQKPPGVHLTYAAGFALFGASDRTVLVLDVIAATLACAFVFAIARRLRSGRAAWAAVIAFAIGTYPAFALPYGGFLERAVPETFITALAAAAAWCAVTSRFALAGLAIGTAVVFKPTALIYWPVMALAGPMFDGRWPMADGRWPMIDVRWPMADGRWAQEVELMDSHGNWLELDGLVLPRFFVRRHTRYFLCGVRGRHLQERAPKLCQHRFEFHVRRPSVVAHWRSNAVAERRRIVGRRRHAEANLRYVLLLVCGEKLREARGAADEDDEQPRRERIERARVSGPLHLQRPAHERDDVVRRRAGRLVYEEGACDRARRVNSQRHNSQRDDSQLPTSSNWLGVGSW
jgi:hypothetical protein